MKIYVENLLLALDLLASAVLAGEPGETLSGRAGSAYLEGALRGRIFMPIIDAVMHLLGQYPTWAGHCLSALANDKRRALAVLEQRT